MRWNVRRDTNFGGHFEVLTQAIGTRTGSVQNKKARERCVARVLSAPSSFALPTREVSTTAPRATSSSLGRCEPLCLPGSFRGPAGQVQHLP